MKVSTGAGTGRHRRRPQGNSACSSCAPIHRPPPAAGDGEMAPLEFRPPLRRSASLMPPSNHITGRVRQYWRRAARAFTANCRVGCGWVRLCRLQVDPPPAPDPVRARLAAVQALYQRRLRDPGRGPAPDSITTAGRRSGGGYADASRFREILCGASMPLDDIDALTPAISPRTVAVPPLQSVPKLPPALLMLAGSPCTSSVISEYVDVAGLLIQARDSSSTACSPLAICEE